MSHLSKIFSVHGFKKVEQQVDLVRLLYLTGCFAVKQLTQDLAMLKCEEQVVANVLQIVTEASKFAEEGDNFLPDIILQGFALDTKDLSSRWPMKLHSWLVLVTQREFLQRKPGQQERWQEQAPHWLVTHSQQVQVIVEHLGLKNEIPPRKNSYDALAIFGSTAPNMKKRLGYAKYLIDNEIVKTNAIYFLTGERYATIDIDGDKAYLQSVAATYHVISEKVTETQLMLTIYQAIKGYGQFSELPVVVIDTPRGNKLRPNTVDTLLQLCIQIDKTIKSMLFISMAPDIQRQAEETVLTLSQHLQELAIDVAGCSSNDEPDSFIINALAEMIFSGFSEVALQFGSKISIEELQQMQALLTQQANEL